MTSTVFKLLLVALLAALAVFGLRVLTDPQTDDGSDVEITDTPSEVAPSPETVEKYPVPEFKTSTDQELVTLPHLADSDAYFKLELTRLFGTSIENTLRDSGGIERFVATIDNLPRSKLAERMRPIDGPIGNFQATASTEGEWLLGEENAARYAPFIELLERVNDAALVELYQRFYPLLQEAYVRLGYPNAYFNDRVVEVIDHLLSTPQPDTPIVLVRPHVLYEFADARLEALSVGQKLMLRMGPNNAAIVRKRLRRLRARIVSLS